MQTVHISCFHGAKSVNFHCCCIKLKKITRFACFLNLISMVEITLMSLLLQITGLAFSSIDPDHIYIQGVDYEVIAFKTTRA
jgi:hypothetical protein